MNRKSVRKKLEEMRGMQENEMVGEKWVTQE